MNSRDAVTAPGLVSGVLAPLAIAICIFVVWLVGAEATLNYASRAFPNFADYMSLILVAFCFWPLVLPAAVGWRIGAWLRGKLS